MKRKLIVFPTAEQARYALQQALGEVRVQDWTATTADNTITHYVAEGNLGKMCGYAFIEATFSGYQGGVPENVYLRAKSLERSPEK